MTARQRTEDGSPSVIMWYLQTFHLPATQQSSLYDYNAKIIMIKFSDFYRTKLRIKNISCPRELLGNKAVPWNETRNWLLCITSMVLWLNSTDLQPGWICLFSYQQSLCSRWVRWQLLRHWGWKLILILAEVVLDYYPRQIFGDTVKNLNEWNTHTRCTVEYSSGSVSHCYKNSTSDVAET